MAVLVIDKFYTYTWLRKDGTPYYIGKGTKNRATVSCEGHRPPCVDDIIIQEHQSETDAFEAEKFLIAYYGRKDLGTGLLRNLTDGGDGVSNPSSTTRARMRQAKLGVKRAPYSAEHCQHIAQGNTGKQRTAESRAKQSASRKGCAPWNKGLKLPFVPHKVSWTDEMREAARQRVLARGNLVGRNAQGVA